MIDSLGYLFYPAVFGMLIWRNNRVLTTDNGFLKAAALSIFECFVMFGSWLLAVWLGILPALGCNLVVALLLGIVAIAAKKNPAWHQACIFGSSLLIAWGVIFTLMRPALAF